MKNILLLLAFLFAGMKQSSPQHRLKKSSAQVITIQTLLFMKNKLAVDDADSYFLRKGFAYSGNNTIGDTVLFRYKRVNSYESLTFQTVNNIKQRVSFYTNSDAKALSLMKSIKLYGFKLIDTSTETNKVLMQFQKGPYFINEVKFYHPEENASSYLITLRSMEQ